MQTATERNTTPGVVYRTTCQNPGCAHTFDLFITAKNASILSGTTPCPRCRRPGGMLKPVGRLGNKLFAAKLVFRGIGFGPSPAATSEEGDLISDLVSPSY